MYYRQELRSLEDHGMLAKSLLSSVGVDPDR